MTHGRGQTLEELARYYGWDPELTRLLKTLPPAAAHQYFEQAWAYDQDGWRHILPPLSGPVLCLDTRFGNTAAAFAEAGAAVTAIHPCPATAELIRHRLALMNFPQVEVIHAPLSANLPFADGRFSAFIHHDVMGMLPMNGAASTPAFPPAIVNEVFRILRPDGFAYFGIKNPWGYTRLLKRLRKPFDVGSSASRLTSVRTAGKFIQRAGFQNLRVYPFLVENGRVSEVVGSSGYQSAKNSFTASERFKQVILGKKTARLLAPAHGLICDKGARPISSLDRFRADLAARNILPPAANDAPSFRRYLSLPGKTIVALGQAEGDAGNIIIVIPKVSRVLEWRRKEIDVVNQLRGLSPFLASRLPRLYTECSCHGETYFAISEISGMTIDRRVRHLALLTRNAVDFLIRFNQITARDVVVDENAFSDHFGSLTRQVAATYPDTGRIMERIETRLRRFLAEKRMATVWFHGDFKLENLIFDKKTLHINGIIDWEHSRRNGLPWLDLLYLLTYNRIMAEDRDFFDVYHRTIQAGDFTQQEKSAIESYSRAMPVSGDMKEVMNCLFFLHHIGFRYIYIMRREDDRRNIFTALEEIENRLARLTG